ncbi:MAG TPA: SgcJ/EcaC family oxidoreductase [Burkholderiales bacterium]|nr:SgcJ/EcaC family oxidoreductase [Burkholderiales bacterium]
MEDDEQQIRNLVSDWMDATRTGDTQRVLELMTEDVVFLVPGRAPMHKSDFAAASHGASRRPQFDGTSEIMEIRVTGDWAYLWTRLIVIITQDGGEVVKRSGHTLSVLRKEQGRWRLARDANLLGPAEPL